MNKLEREFYKALKDSIDASENDFDGRQDDRPYYKKAYWYEMNRLFDQWGIKSVQRRYLHALASSARLAFHDFRDKKGVEFEKNVSNDLEDPKGSTEIDVAIGRIYYECKCQEILKYHPVVLKRRYKDSNLFKEFDCKFYEKGDEIRVNIESLGIDIPKDHLPDKWRFEIKQLICHLIAIAHERDTLELSQKDPTTLRYLIYVPQKDKVDKKGLVVAVYEELKEEINSIWKKDNSITDFCWNHGIVLADPSFKSIDEINDKVLRDLKKCY